MSRKQIGVIYRAFKEGFLPDVQQADVNNIYAYVDKMYNYDFARKEGNDVINSLKEAVNAIFAGDYDTANSILKGFQTVAV